MTRKAILLGALPQGAESETAAWYHFLRSNCGGAWFDDEITRLTNPDRDATLAAVRAAKDANYSLLVFVGRGEIRKGERPWPEAHVLLYDAVSLSERDLNPGTPLCTLIFDWSTAADTEPAPAGRNAEPDGPQLRALFDQALGQAEGGLVRVHASAVSPATGQAPSFSTLLLRAAREWAIMNHGILSLPQALSLVVEALSKSNSPLKAEYQGGRRLRHFPFAVSPQTPPTP